jgi:hypothetical protein
MLRALLRRVRSLEARFPLRPPPHRKTRADVEAAFCRVAGRPLKDLSDQQRGQIEALWTRIKELSKTDRYLANLFDTREQP